MPSLPALPAKNSSLRDTTATNALLSKATREYLNRDFPAALSTITILRAQQLSPRTKRKAFLLYLALLDSVTSLDAQDLQYAFGREGAKLTQKLRAGTVWAEAEAFFDGPLHRDVAANMILSLTSHMDNTAKLQDQVEGLLTSLDPDTIDHESISELYALHVLPQCNEWDAARGYIENCDMPETKKTRWLEVLEKTNVAQAQEKERLTVENREAEEARIAEKSAKELRRVRRSAKGGSKKSTTSNTGSVSSSRKLPGGPDVIPLNDSNLARQNSRGTEIVAKSDTSASLPSITRWTRSIALRFSPRFFRILIFLALLFGATGRREIRESIQLAMRKLGSTVAAGLKVSYI